MDSDLKGAVSTGTTLPKAASQNRIDIVRSLLDEGADPNEIDSIGNTALHTAAEGGYWDIARLLLERNASPTIKNANDSIPLHLAVKRCRHPVARLLLECENSLLNYSNKQMDSPIHIAARNGDLEMINLLLEFKVNTSSITTGNTTALHLAVEKEHQELCAILLEYDKKYSVPLVLRMVGYKAAHKTKDWHDETPFALAIKSGNINIIKVFFQSGTVSGKEKNGFKRPLFHDAVKEGKTEIVKTFLENGTDINMKGWDSQRAIHVAVKEKDIDMVRLLLEYGPSLQVKDGSLCTPEQVSYDPEITMMLRNHGKDKNKDRGKRKKRSGEKSPPPRIASSAPPPEYTP